MIFNMTAQTTLEQEKKELEGQLFQLEKTDPKNDPNRLQENVSEDDAEEAEKGWRVFSFKQVICDRLRDVQGALKKIRGGSYGICDRCGEKIDPARLKAVSDATYCFDCEKQLE